MLEPSARQKHVLHCLLLLSIIFFFELKSGGIKLWYTDNDPGEYDPFLKYGYYFAWMLYLLRLVTLLSLPQFLCNFFGLVLYNAFPDDVCVQEVPLVLPFICIRTVTRGDFPDLIRRNVMRNIESCIDAGLQNFLFEVVTDKPFEISKDSRIRLIVVPPNYKTKSGALFKVRRIISKVSCIKKFCLGQGFTVLFRK